MEEKKKKNIWSSFWVNKKSVKETQNQFKVNSFSKVRLEGNFHFLARKANVLKCEMFEVFHSKTGTRHKWMLPLLLFKIALEQKSRPVDIKRGNRYEYWKERDSIRWQYDHLHRKFKWIVNVWKITRVKSRNLPMQKQ